MISICYEACKKCNLKCEYCISSDNKNGNTDNEDDYEYIIKKISKLNPQRIVVSGGEPLLDLSLIKKLKLIRCLCPDTYVSLSTNGSISYNWVNIKTYVDCVDVSLPALDESIYEMMRGENHVNNVLENIKRIREIGIVTKISYVLTKVNKNELFSILDMAKKLNIEAVRIGRYLPLRNAVNFRNKYELDQCEIDSIIKDVYNRNYKFDITPPIDDLQAIENSYLNIDYNGKFFLPTRDGKLYLTEEDIVKKIGNQYNIFKKVQLKDNYEKYFRPIRTRKSDEERVLVDEFYSDRTRIIYSAAFRRMQQKAQVFSLEKNPSVRSRLTHSIEVSDIGRRLALRISEALIDSNIFKLESKYESSLIAIVENACLLHDIGNPPFGHFGEAAIKKWWKEKHDDYINSYNERAKNRSESFINFSTPNRKKLLMDFQEFDGNPQGLRNIIRLCGNKDNETDFMQSGLNLTYPTILCNLKYIRAAGEDGIDKSVCKDLLKKAGYFQSEKNVFEKIYRDMGMYPDNLRYPFAYIMEAADDIAYGLSDIEDGIEKKLYQLNFSLIYF